MNIKNLFIEKDEEATVKPPAVKQNGNQPPIITSIPTPTVASSVSVQSTTDYGAHILELLKKNNIPGPDYFEFRSALDTMAGQPLTDQQKYLSVFSGFSAMGVTAAKLAETAQFYIGKIEDEKTAFNVDLTNARKIGITDKQTEKTALEKENENLTKQIQDNLDKISKINSDVNSATLKLNSEEAAFSQACVNETQNITNQISNIKTYLPNGTTTK